MKVWAVIRYTDYGQDLIESFRIFSNKNEAKHDLMKARNELGLFNKHKYEMDIREIEVI